MKSMTFAGAAIVDYFKVVCSGIQVRSVDKRAAAMIAISDHSHDLHPDLTSTSTLTHTEPGDHITDPLG